MLRLTPLQSSTPVRSKRVAFSRFGGVRSMCVGDVIGDRRVGTMYGCRLRVGVRYR
jgi:hypothetical protein